MKTFSRDHWNEAQQAWDDGEFSDEWKPYRHEAAMRGMLYPPRGTALDSWDDYDPSDRAMLIRAIRETPKLMHWAVAKSSSWPEVVARVIRKRDDWNEEMEARELAAARRRAEHEADDKQATLALKAVLNRLSDS